MSFIQGRNESKIIKIFHNNTCKIGTFVGIYYHVYMKVPEGYGLVTLYEGP